MTALLMALASSTQAHEGHGGMSHAPTPPTKTERYEPPKDLDLDARTLRPLHGGQVTATKWHFFEVVYTPQETRIYVYSPSRRLWGASGMRGEVVMQVNGSEKPFRFPVKQARDADGAIYGSVAVDVSRVRDGDMQVTFDLSKLPFEEEKRAQFTQTFALTRPPVPVTVAPLTEADRPLIDRQQVCPVMEAELDDHGAPIKLMVADQPLFVCCEDCIEKVRNNPRMYLAKVAQGMQASQQPSVRPQVSVSYATQSDNEAIRAQGVCPVLGQPLGAHGTPIKIVINGQSIFVCCKGCVNKVAQNPVEYLNKIAQGRQVR